MLLNSQTVKGLPVICGINGKKIGIVLDIKYTPGKKKIDGILVQNHLNLSGSNFIPIDKIITFGKAAVIVEKDYFQEKEKSEMIEQSILGRSVMGADGYELGSISDIVFDSEEGLIVGYEISKGVIDDLISGRILLSENTFSHIDTGSDVIVISSEQGNDIKVNNGGLKNIFFKEY